jgi:hypothetical protein
MKKGLLLLFTLISCVTFAQIYQNPLLFGKYENRLAVNLAFAVPADTLAPPAAVQGLPHIAVKNGIFYVWGIGDHI